MPIVASIAASNNSRTQRWARRDAATKTDTALARHEPGGTEEVLTYFLYDGLGCTADLTDGSGKSVDGYTYDVFGAIRARSGSSDNAWLFTREQQQSDSKL